MTNRDKFNKISNAELADILSRTLGADTCKFCCYAKEKCLGKSCTEEIEKWLNASCEPAWHINRQIQRLECVEND